MNSRVHFCTAVLLLEMLLLIAAAKCAEPSGLTNSATTIPKGEEALISTIEHEFPSKVGHDEDGKVRFLDVPYRYVSNGNLALIGQCASLRELKLQLSSRNPVTSAGIENLSRIPGLEKLTIMCPHVLQDGLFEAVTKLKTVRSLALNLADPLSSEYSFLTNMAQLRELTIVEAPHFGNTQALMALNLPSLTKLTLANTSVSYTLLSAVSKSAGLTNVTIISSHGGGGETVVWTKEEPVKWRNP